MIDSAIMWDYSETMEHNKWCKEIPFINFPEDWLIQIIPPFAGAVVRFRVKKDKAEVSIYLDCYDNLGIYGKPYWEVYPYNDDVFRCDLKDIEGLITAITRSIKEQNT